MIEIIASTVKDAMAIQEGGAHRIELVSALSEGGLTPSLGLIQEVLKAVSIPVYVMLRPISSSFCYEKHHLQVMKADAMAMEQIGVGHVVAGMLDEEGLPALDQLEYVLSDTGLTATFHRAFDQASDLDKALERINSCHRITHLLTSGGPGKAWDNLPTLRRLLIQSRPRIVVGSGIGLDNVAEIQEALCFENSNGFDLHAGTALRHGELHGDVDSALVKAFATSVGALP